MTTDLLALAADPSPLERAFRVGGADLVFRALEPGDGPALAAFLDGLSEMSRRFWHGDADAAGEAACWIDAIGRYDKLRLVAHPAGQPTALSAIIDLSFSVPDFAEAGRYARYGTHLDPDHTARFGPCVADAWQGTGLAQMVLGPTWGAVRLLGRDRVVLIGGVHEANVRARRFYERAGFVEAGRFTCGGMVSIDMALSLRADT